VWSLEFFHYNRHRGESRTFEGGGARCTDKKSDSKILKEGVTSQKMFNYKRKLKKPVSKGGHRPSQQAPPFNPLLGHAMAVRLRGRPLEK